MSLGWPRWLRARSEKPVERILIYRLGSLGDTIVALPCFHKIAECFPDAERYILTNVPVSSKAAPLESILGNSGLIDGAIVYPLRLRSIRQLWALARQLRLLGASTLIFLMTSRGLLTVYRDIIFFRLCGIKRIVGAPTTHDLDNCREDLATGFIEQECVRLARTLAELGPIDLDSRSNWDLRLTDQEREAGRSAIAPFDSRPFIAINMGGKAAENHWGEKNWHRLFTELAGTHGDYGLLVVGGADDAACVAEVTRNWPGPVVNACGRLAPRESAAALEHARLFAGHDSGPMHLAASRGVTCIGLFSGINRPRRWHPYGNQHIIIHRTCLEGIAAIGVDEVAKVVRHCLPETKAMQVKSRS